MGRARPILPTSQPLRTTLGRLVRERASTGPRDTWHRIGHELRKAAVDGQRLSTLRWNRSKGSSDPEGYLSQAKDIVAMMVLNIRCT